MRIYFAAPLFNDAERGFNEDVCGLLEDAGHSVFLPQRDGFEGFDDLLEREDIGTEEAAMAEIFRVDRAEVIAADLLTAVVDGAVTDAGVAVEMGIAHEHGVPIVALRTDSRTFAEDEPLNSMVFGTIDDLVGTPGALVEAVDGYTTGDD